MKVALYIRVSTEEQATEGYSIRGQKTQLVDYCRVNDYEITKIYIDEGLSAKDTKRPELQQMIRDAELKMFDAILVYKLDRFSRSAKDLHELVDHIQTFGVDFISKQEKFDTTTAMGRLMFGFLAVLAQFERELIAERVRLGMEQKVREGKRHGGKYPFGYDSKGELVEEEAEQLRRIRELYMSGLSYQGVASKMLTDGFMRRKYEWSASTVALTLENPFYAGIIRFGSKLPNGKYAYRKREEKVKVMDVPGTHEAVWTAEEFAEHVARMRRRAEGGFNNRKANYWFNGVLRCGRCGASMFGKQTTKRTLKSGKEVTNSYYWCSRRKANKGCDMPMFRQTHIERLIMGHIDKIRVDHEAINAEKTTLKQKEDNRKKEQASLRRDLDKVKARIKKWQYAFVEDLISDADLKRRMNEERDSEAEILNKLLQLEDTTETDIFDRLIDLSELWTSLDDADKNEAITTIFERITLNTNETNVKGVKNTFFPASVEVEYK